MEKKLKIASLLPEYRFAEKKSRKLVNYTRKRLRWNGRGTWALCFTFFAGPAEPAVILNFYQSVRGKISGLLVMPRTNDII
jgi:hypothetical protein